MPTLEVDDQTLRVLTDQARARGVPVATFVRILTDAVTVIVGDALVTQAADRPVALVEFDRCLDALAAELPDAPPLPADFSRADIYNGHD